MQPHTVYFICKLLYMFRLVSPPVNRSIYLNLQHLVLVKDCCYLSLSWIARGSIIVNRCIWYYSTVVVTCLYRG